ncbi:MAG: helix-hairpin-helix domain-containing protein [Mycobacterium sp.]
MVDPDDRGPVFDGLRIGRPATGALIDAGYHSIASIADLPADLDGLLALHGVGSAAVRLLRQARTD